jgi:hypothetical protein
MNIFDISFGISILQILLNYDQHLNPNKFFLFFLPKKQKGYFENFDKI